MKNILVPCDFSAAAHEAFKVAIEVAAKCHGHVTLIHVLYLPPVHDGVYAEGTPYAPELFHQMEVEVRTAFNEMIVGLPNDSPAVNVEIRIGNVVDTIIGIIGEQGTDLVVMGRTGSSGMIDFLVGSTTEKVVRHSPVPVLAIEKADFIGTVKHILVPSTLGFNQTYYMDRVIALQYFFKSTLHILHVNTPSNFKRDRDAYAAMEEFARHYHLQNFKTHFVNDYTEEAGIIAFAQTQNIDLIAIGTHARKGLSHLFHTSITENLVNHYHGAVWTCALKN